MKKVSYEKLLINAGKIDTSLLRRHRMYGWRTVERKSEVGSTFYLLV